MAILLAGVYVEFHCGILRFLGVRGFFVFFRCLSLCFFGGSVVVLGLYFFGLVVFFRVGPFGFSVEFFLGFLRVFCGL